MTTLTKLLLGNNAIFGQHWDFKSLFEIHVAIRLGNDDGQL